MKTFVNRLGLNQCTLIQVGLEGGLKLLKIMRFEGPVLFYLLLQTEITPILNGNKFPFL